ncbi:hypothetical protein FI667_g6632, partial [Globisporangium splendens]
MRSAMARTRRRLLSNLSSERWLRLLFFFARCAVSSLPSPPPKKGLKLTTSSEASSDSTGQMDTIADLIRSEDTTDLADAMEEVLELVDPEEVSRQLADGQLKLLSAASIGGLRDFEIPVDILTENELMKPDSDAWMLPRIELTKLPTAAQEIVDEILCSSTPDMDRLTTRVGTTVAVNLWRFGEESELRENLLWVAASHYCAEDEFEAPLSEVSVS